MIADKTVEQRMEHLQMSLRKLELEIARAKLGKPNCPDLRLAKVVKDIVCVLEELVSERNVPR